MWVLLCYKNVVLGALTFQNGEYVYYSNFEGEKKFKQYIASATYSLFDSDPKVSTKLFDEYAEFLRDIKSRTDLKRLAQISDSDDDFSTLVKLSKLNQDKFGFHIAFSADKK